MTATRTTKAQLAAQIAEMALKVAALEARLTVATEVYRNQRTRIAELEARVATPGVKASPAPQATPVTVAQPVTTTYYDRAGNLWEKTRLGNKASSRIVAPAERDLAHEADLRDEYHAQLRADCYDEIEA